MVSNIFSGLISEWFGVPLAISDLRRFGIETRDAKACAVALSALRYPPATIEAVLGTIKNEGSRT